LTVESGLASPPQIELDEQYRARLGRNRDSDLILQDRHASRNHAELFYSNGIWHLCDLETTNGTRLDGTPIRGESAIEHGQTITIGEVHLRFTLSEEQKDEDHTSITAVIDVSDTTLLHADELTALFRFMNHSLAEPTPHRLATLALETILRQTGADMAGFLSLDAAAELRLVLPAQASVDRQLSQRLTQQVQQQGRLVWLHSPEDRSFESDSLLSFHDAVCVPLRATATEAPLGALHVYKTTRTFHEREVRFCEVLASSLAAALHLQRARRALEADNSRLRIHASGAGDELVGSSPAMTQLRQQVRRLAEGPLTVLIFGESGVGKELVALGLHRQSSRHKGPMVTVNCAAINGSMAESELFGHVKGAFTGAVRDHPGYFAQADMGTLFLDELGELSLDLQAKLLRAIETKCFRPVGARADQRADVRIIAATNRNLEREAQEGRFRRDLFFRLTSRIVVPPLRDHLDDVPDLARHFLEHLNAEYRRRVSLSEATLERLMTYSWPGNVRQLRSVLEGAVAMATDDAVLNAGDLNLPDCSTMQAECPPSLNLEALEEWAIRQALAETGNNNTQAARLLGIHRDTLINKLRKYRIEKGA
jgi:Nif-specific regulatory protein